MCASYAMCSGAFHRIGPPPLGRIRPPLPGTAVPPDANEIPTPAGDTAAFLALDVDPQVRGGGWTQRLREERNFLLCLAFSLAVHAAFFVTITVLAGMMPESRIQFDASDGVALMARYGLMNGDPDLLEAPDERPEVAGQGGQVEPQDLVPDDPSDEPLEDDETDEVDDADPSDDAAEIDETSEVPELEAIDGAPSDDETPGGAVGATPEPEVQEETDAERRAREAAEAQARRERRARRAAEAAAREASQQETREEEIARRRRDDPMSLVPGVRYPEGTLNPSGTDIGMWGPEGARVVLILRSDRIRSSVHRRNLENILAGLPDWRDLVGGAEIDVFEDMDAALIASSDPRWVNRTFLAAVHRIPPEEVMARLSRGYPAGVQWEARRGRVVGRQVSPQQCGARACDPREFLIPTQNLFIFSRPEFIEPLIRDGGRARGMDEAVRLAGDAEGLAAVLRLPEGSESAAEPVRRRAARASDSPPLREDGWTTGLLSIMDFGGTGRDGPAANLTFTGFSLFRLDGMGRIAPPQALHAVIHATPDVRLTGRFVFATAAEARAWIDQWPSIVSAHRLALATFGLFTVLRDADWTVDHNEAVLDLVIPRATMDRVATTAALMNAAR
jgi:hypothetical protein